VYLKNKQTMTRQKYMEYITQELPKNTKAILGYVLVLLVLTVTLFVSLYLLQNKSSYKAVEQTVKAKLVKREFGTLACPISLYVVQEDNTYRSLCLTGEYSNSIAKFVINNPQVLVTYTLLDNKVIKASAVW
jgi:hypothetical protein